MNSKNEGRIFYQMNNNFYEVANLVDYNPAQFKVNQEVSS